MAPQYLTQRFTMACLSTLIAIALITPPANAELLVYEPFNYDTGDLNTNNGSATGLTGAWTGSGSFDVTAGSLDQPTSSTFDSIGNKVALAGSNGTNPRIDRPLSSAIDFDADGVYYISFLMNDTNVSTSAEYFYVGLRDSTAPDQTWDIAAAFGIGSSETMIMVTVDAETHFTTGPAIPTGQDVLVVGKIVTKASGNDEAYMTVYQHSASIPATEPIAWSVMRSEVITGSADELTLLAGNLTQTRVDEIRIGTTFLSVTTVPAPAALPAGLLLLAAAAVRRHRH